MFRKTDTIDAPAPAKAEPGDRYRVVTVSSSDKAVRKMLDETTDLGWSLIAIHPIISGIGGGTMTTVQMVFTR